MRHGDGVWVSERMWHATCVMLLLSRCQMSLMAVQAGQFKHVVRVLWLLVHAQ
jgi:hypothetical protein